jgi:serine O-acetyltransferase
MEKIKNKYKDILDLSYLTKEYLLYEYLCDENDINLLFQKIGYLFRHSIDNNIETEKKYLSNLDKIKKELYLDLATYMINDPSCNKEEEVVLCYPGYQALIFYRIAHLLFVMGYKLAARIIAEDAHSKTGVDIHPGATIDKGVFIDHGTGVVIGETSIIETGVKIYQGVTLGASNLSKGYLLKGVKRHPTIKKNVTLYADCKIIGGETIIDENSVIGAGVVINNSIDKNKIVSMETKLIIKDVT